MGDMKNWLGEDWEAYCILLLRRHYGPEKVQEVPARHGGDLGIEAFTHDGCVIQCYAPNMYATVQDRYESQRQKLTEDLAKLELNQRELIDILGDIKIRTYMFMVPVLDSRKIVQHASRKTREYRQKNLLHLASDFRIAVVTDEAFSDSREHITRQDAVLESLQRTGAVLNLDINSYDPILDMGIHPPMEWSAGPRLPSYVPRQIDRQLDQAIESGGLVIIEGPSASGKSRTGYEALKRNIKRMRWRSVLVPRDGVSLRRLVEVGTNSRNIAIWLDDLERFLSPDGLDDALVSVLCPIGRKDVLLLATLRAQAKSVLKLNAERLGEGNFMRGADRALASARIIRLERQLNGDERHDAAALRADPRIDGALDNPDNCGLAEYIAAGPATVSRWRDGKDGANEIGAALVSAAVDIRLGGYISPIPKHWLQQAYKYYLDPRTRNRIRHPDLDSAFAWATQEVHGASSCLMPHEGDRYSIFDYLLDFRQDDNNNKETDNKGSTLLGKLKSVPDEIWHDILANLRLDDPNFLSCASVAMVVGHPLLALVLRDRLARGDFGIEKVGESQLIALVRTCAAVGLCVACMTIALELDVTVVLGRLLDSLEPGMISHSPIDSRRQDILFALRQFAIDGRPDQSNRPISKASANLPAEKIFELGSVLVSEG